MAMQTVWCAKCGGVARVLSAKRARPTEPVLCGACEGNHCEAQKQSRGPYIYQQGTRCTRKAVVEIQGKHLCKQHAARR